MNLRDFAKRELTGAGWFKKDDMYEGMIGTSVYELVSTFAKQGHSGMSAGIVISLFNKVAKYKQLTPFKNPTITYEYTCQSEMSKDDCLQSTRQFNVFSKDKGKSWYRNSSIVRGDYCTYVEIPLEFDETTDEEIEYEIRKD